MTPEHIEKLNAAKRKRAEAAEKATRRQVKWLMPLLSDFDRAKIAYIHAQLDKPDRDEPTDLIRSVRSDIIRRYSPKEATTA